MTDDDETANILEAVLMFHDGGMIWDDRNQSRWEKLTGSREVTSKALCDSVRRVLHGRPKKKEIKEHQWSRGSHLAGTVCALCGVRLNEVTELGRCGNVDL